MKKFFIVGIVAFIVGCSNEAEFPDKHFPYVLMNETNVSAGGVEFVAEFRALGDTPIKRYGFLWWEGDHPMDSTAYYIREIDAKPSLGTFSLNVESDLARGKTYQVRPFAVTASITVLGNILVFGGFETKAPKIDSFSPKSGGPGDIITITGSNFSISTNRIKVSIGTDIGILLSSNQNEIKFQLPQNLSVAGEVPLMVKSGDTDVLAADPFLIKGHVITDFSPKQGIIGETEVVISGNGFLETGNIVSVGGHQAVVLHESKTEIRIRLPFQMTVGVVPIVVDAHGQAATVNGFTVKSRWVRLSDFPGAPRLNPYCTVIGDFIYLIGGETNTYSDEVWKYDIARDSWTRLPNFPGGGRYGPAAFTIGTTIYYGLGGGSGGISDFWSFNTSTGEWKKTFSLASIDGPPICTSIDGIGYVFGGYHNGNYSFTPTKGWTWLGPFPDLSISTYYDSYLEIGDDRYDINMLTDGNSGKKTYNIYKLERADPSDWKLVDTIQPFSKRSYNAISFVANGLAYIGEGAVEEEDRTFIKLDMTTRQWTQIENFQGPLFVRSGVSLTYKDKGYVGFGLLRYPGTINFGSTNQFWKYDPSIQ